MPVGVTNPAAGDQNVGHLITHILTFTPQFYGIGIPPYPPPESQDSTIRRGHEAPARPATMPFP